MEEVYPKDFRDRVDYFNTDFNQQVVKQEKVELESGVYAFFYLFANGLKLIQMASTMGSAVHSYTGVVPKVYRPMLLQAYLVGSCAGGKYRVCQLESNGNLTISASDALGMMITAVYM